MLAISVSAICWLAARALAEFGKADMPALAQFQPGGNQHAVNIHAGLPLELEQHAHRARYRWRRGSEPSRRSRESRRSESGPAATAPRWRWPSSASPKECSSLAPRCSSGIFSLTTVLSEPALGQHNECAGVERRLTVFETSWPSSCRRRIALVIGCRAARLWYRRHAAEVGRLNVRKRNKCKMM